MHIYFFKGLDPCLKEEQKSGLDPFDDDDADELKALAKKFEDKYVSYSYASASQDISSN